jgi:hypothetical protein
MADVDFSSLVFIDSGGLPGAKRRPDPERRHAQGQEGRGDRRHDDRAAPARDVRDRGLDATIVTVRDGPRAGDARRGHDRRVRRRQGQARRARGHVEEPDALALLAADLSFEPFAFALPRNDSAFRLVVNRELTRIYVSPDIDTIYNRWFGRLGRPSGALASMYLLNAIPD